MSPTIVPEQPTALDALRAIELTYGTEDLAAAMETLRYDQNFRARRRAANPVELRSVLAAAEMLNPSMAAEVAAGVAAIGTATPYPGIAA